MNPKPHIEQDQKIRNPQSAIRNPLSPDPEELSEKVAFDFGFSRRNFVQLLSTGLFVAVNVAPALAQRRGGGGFGGTRIRNIPARIHIGKDGLIPGMAGKVEIGQGARARLPQAPPQELFVPPRPILM